MKELIAHFRRWLRGEIEPQPPGPCVVCGAPPGEEIGSLCRKCWDEMMQVCDYHAFILSCPCKQVSMDTMDAVTIEYERHALHCDECEVFQAEKAKRLRSQNETPIRC